MKLAFVRLLETLVMILGTSTLAAGQAYRWVDDSDSDSDEPLPMDLSWLPDRPEGPSTGRATFRAHRKNYLLLSYDDRFQAPERDGELKFQISMRSNLFEVDRDKRIVGAYTNRSFWQIMQESKPFRTTDHEPELFFEWDLRDEEMQVRAGYIHLSNGEDGSDSRRLDRYFAEALRYWGQTDSGSLRGGLRLWLRGPIDKQNNPDIRDYYGIGDLRCDYMWRGKHRRLISAVIRPARRGAVELNFSLAPFHKAPEFRVLCQYYNGYGESIHAYDVNSNRISFGLELSP